MCAFSVTSWVGRGVTGGEERCLILWILAGEPGRVNCLSGWTDYGFAPSRRLWQRFRNRLALYESLTWYVVPWLYVGRESDSRFGFEGTMSVE